MKKIGFLVNPVAGLGGQAGMKGSDGERSREQALSLGYQKTALRRASAAIGQIRGGADHRADTIAYARAMGAKGVELLVFCGGDGTARDIYEAVGSQFPVLGIPAGVKMYSACYAVNPWQTRELLRDFIRGRKLSFVPREGDGYGRGISVGGRGKPCSVRLSESPGRWCKAAEGNGWGRAMNERGSHGSRENANEYFGTETGLWGITAGVYLACMGPQGMYELREAIIQNVNYAIQKLKEVPGVWVDVFQNRNFQEFVVDFTDTGKTVKEINQALLKEKIFGGKDLRGC